MDAFGRVWGLAYGFVGEGASEHGALDVLVQVTVVEVVLLTRLHGHTTQYTHNGGV